MLLEQIAYEAALRALDKQEALVAEVRARTGLLLGAASIATSFVAPSGRDRLAFAVALASFLLLVAAAVRVLLPSTRLEFAVGGRLAYEALFEVRDDPQEIYRELLYEADRLRERNNPAMTRLQRFYRLACGALALEVLVLVALATDTIG